MDIPVRRGNIFTLLEDEEAEEVQVPKSKQTKTPAAPAAQPKAENKSAKPKPPAKKPQKDPEPPAHEAPKTQAKEQRKPKYEDKPERDDRKSKTGRGREIKKGGAGRNNWGKPEDDAKLEPSSELPEDQSKAQEGEGDQADVNKEDNPAEAEQDKKPDFITFSDFLNPKATGEEEEGKDESEEEADNAKGLLNFKVSFGNRGESSGTRGGRRGGRGGRGGRGRRDGEGRDENDKDKGAREQKGNKRNYEQKPKNEARNDYAAAPNPNDFKAFPSLG